MSKKLIVIFRALNRLRELSQYAAVHDSLTKLPNRMLLDQAISQGIELSKRHRKQLAVVF